MTPDSSREGSPTLLGDGAKGGGAVCTEDAHGIQCYNHEDLQAPPPTDGDSIHASDGSQAGVEGYPWPDFLPHIRASSRGGTPVRRPPRRTSIVSFGSISPRSNSEVSGGTTLVREFWEGTEPDFEFLPEDLWACRGCRGYWVAHDHPYAHRARWRAPKAQPDMACEVCPLCPGKRYVSTNMPDRIVYEGTWYPRGDAIKMVFVGVQWVWPDPQRVGEPWLPPTEEDGYPVKPIVKPDPTFVEDRPTIYEMVGPDTLTAIDLSGGERGSEAQLKGKAPASLPGLSAPEAARLAAMASVEAIRGSHGPISIQPLSAEPALSQRSREMLAPPAHLPQPKGEKARDGVDSPAMACHSADSSVSAVQLFMLARTHGEDSSESVVGGIPRGRRRWIPDP